MSVYSYADESGNTGANLFDADQPVFYAAAVIAKFDFDAEFERLFNGFARAEDFTHLHAAEMGLGRLSKISRKLETRIVKDEISFFTAKIIKRDLIVAKLFDTVFDPHENKAVPWHAYWIREMRFFAIIKLNHIVTDEILRGFWASLMERDESLSRTQFLDAARKLLRRVAMIPDQRSREIFRDAIAWSISYPDEISFHSKKKKSGLSHLPNLLAFSPMLQAIDSKAEFWQKPVKVIKHDRESQIQNLLRDWHQMLSNAREGTFSLYGREFKSRAVSGSEFEVCRSEDSPGIQMADIVLWLMKRSDEQGSLGERADSLLACVRSQAEPLEVSMAYTVSEAERMHDFIMSQPFTEEDRQRGQSTVDQGEARRKQQMAEQPISATA